MTKEQLKELDGLQQNLIQEQAIITLHALNVKEIAEQIEHILSKEAAMIGVDLSEVEEF